MEAEERLVAGYKLDRYELLCPIASGGMATVWLARLRGKRGFEKLFAVKMIKSEYTADPRFQEMFLDEARIASAIEHPNVAQILDLGESDGMLYTVMEWVDGESLAKLSRLARKRNTPLPLGVVLRIVADACAGLHAAHELRDENDARLGVVHRDVSPQNILVTSKGAVKVIDFGVAKAVNRRSEGTQSGVVKGKIRFLAPEQVGESEVDHRADIWAMGMTILELVTGKPPFDELNDIDVIKKLMSDDPLPKLEGTPAELAPIFASTIVSLPEARYPTASALRRAIEKTLDALGEVTSDDVGEFIGKELPDLARSRRTIVQKAVDDSKKRVVPGSPSAPPDDVAFAPTIASRPTPAPASAKTAAAVPKAKARDDLSGPKTTAGATLRGQVGERRSSMFPWLVGVVVVAGVGTSLWFANERYRLTEAEHPIASASASVSAAAASAEPPPSASAEPPPASASASASAEPVVELDAADTAAPPPRRFRWPAALPGAGAGAAAAADAGATPPHKKWNPMGDDPVPAPSSDMPPELKP
ncbi:MAG TPA: serine/threonine-protein kinase [Labilithrix sp.]